MILWAQKQCNELELTNPLKLNVWSFITNEFQQTMQLHLLCLLNHSPVSLLIIQITNGALSNNISNIICFHWGISNPPRVWTVALRLVRTGTMSSCSDVWFGAIYWLEFFVQAYFYLVDHIPFGFLEEMKLLLFI